jgi:hypothetical protein
VVVLKDKFCGAAVVILNVTNTSCRKPIISAGKYAALF